MIDILDKFKNLNREIKNVQYPIQTTGSIKVYYGFNKDGYFRTSFLSSRETDINGSTKNIDVIKGYASETNYWTCFDLKNESLISGFSALSEDLISCVKDEKDEKKAIAKLKSRYQVWLALFKKEYNSLSYESAKGLYGELYFLLNNLLKTYSVNDAINAWSGPERYSKDFSINDTWFEVKTVKPTSAVVKISSISQLLSDYVGNLVIIKVEDMADSFNGANSSINNICRSILSSIEDDYLKDTFLSKLNDVGYNFNDAIGDKKFDVQSLKIYKVDEKFPVLKLSAENSYAINNASYELIINEIRNFEVSE